MSNGINTPQGLQIVESAIGNGGTQKLKPYFIYSNTDAGVTTTLGSSIFANDPVTWSKTAAVPGAPALTGTGGTIIPLSAIGNAGVVAATAILGIFVSCSYISAQTKLLTESDYWPGGTQVIPGTPIIAYINDDPDIIFRVPYSTSTNDYTDTLYLLSENGTNANLAVGGVEITDNIPVAYAPFLQQNKPSGNTFNGISAYYLDGSTIDTGAGNPGFNVKIIGVAPETNLLSNSGTTAFPSLLVGSTMPFVNVLCKFNNHVYGSSGVAGPVLA